jgi:hypothetical protein
MYISFKHTHILKTVHKSFILAKLFMFHKTYQLSLVVNRVPHYYYSKDTNLPRVPKEKYS